MPQKSVLGPVLIILYNVEATAIAHRHNIDAHSYSDYTQLLINRKVEEMESSTPHLVKCIDEINCWMSANRLKLNTDKTQLIQQLVKVKRKFIFLHDVIYSVHRRCHMAGRGVRQRITDFYTYRAVGQKVLLSSASGTFCAPPATHLSPLQSGLNAAARLIVKKRK